MRPGFSILPGQETMSGEQIPEICRFECILLHLYASTCTQILVIKFVRYRYSATYDLVEVAGVEPDQVFHVVASICICSYLTASCGMALIHTNADRCIKMRENWQKIGKPRIVARRWSLRTLENYSSIHGKGGTRTRTSRASIFDYFHLTLLISTLQPSRISRK